MNDLDRDTIQEYFHEIYEGMLAAAEAFYDFEDYILSESDDNDMETEKIF
jgi:hypothetical protein